MFEDLALDRRLQLGLDALGFDAPTAVQEEVVGIALQGTDLLVSAETGSGKTLAYLLPMAQKILSSDLQDSRGTLGLILVPTRELARQVLKVARDLLRNSPLKVQGITGGADFKYQKSLLRKDPELLVATPGRLLEHCEKGSTDFSCLGTLVLDEADRMLDLGFRDDVMQLIGHCPAQRQVILLSATLSHRGVHAIAGDLLREPHEISLGEVRDAHRNIFHQRILADSLEHKDKLLLALTATDPARKTLVFANKRTTTARLAGLGLHHGRRFEALHGEMSTEKRKAVVQKFRDGRIDVLCASDVAARGLDIEGIETVINYDVPYSGQDYQHRTGRTGRAEAQGLAITLVSAPEWNPMISIQRYLGMELEQRSLPGLKARYNGPKKQKSTGKAAGPKKKPRRKAKEKARSRARNKKSTGKRDTNKGANDGFAPLTRKKRDD
ncbi:MAG: DEAD/DEAH box helicase [Halioglobus sp.]|nr:DEAD/DEAH box helicase [Halioglobus sp.]